MLEDEESEVAAVDGGVAIGQEVIMILSAQPHAASLKRHKQCG